MVGAKVVILLPNSLRCPGGGIGRRSRLKICRLHGCAGSIPVLGTQPLFLRGLLFLPLQLQALLLLHFNLLHFPILTFQKNTLVQNETALTVTPIDKDLIIVSGNGSDLSNDKAIKGRAKRKLITKERY